VPTLGGRRKTAVTAIALSFALAVGGALLRGVNSEPVERSAELIGLMGFALVLAAPAFLGLLGIRGRPPLLVAAGILDLVLVVLGLISFVGLAFLPPAALFLVSPRRAESPAGLVRSLVAVLLAVALGVAAFFALFAREDPICWSTTPGGGQVRLGTDSFVVNGSTIRIEADAGESGCSTDYITPAEAPLAAGLLVLMLAASWSAFALPRRVAVHNGQP
jgi:hypothetical protein